jgi:hypothetical protein
MAGGIGGGGGGGSGGGGGGGGYTIYPTSVFVDGGVLSSGNAVGLLFHEGGHIMDIIFAPIKPPEGGLGLFKAIKIRLSTNASGGVMTNLRVYKKGNMPKDELDTPDYEVTDTVGNGDYIFNLPHIVTEELIVRLRIVLSNDYDPTLSQEMNDTIKSNVSPRVRLLNLWVDMDKYGDIHNIHETGWSV